MTPAGAGDPSRGDRDDDEPAPPRDLDALEERLSRPTDAVAGVLARTSGDLVVLGAGGKMGPSLARMARRAFDALGGPHAGRRVVAASRFSDPAARRQFESHGVETATVDLLDRRSVAALPDAPLVVYMAGLKFGVSDAPARMWATNTVAPALVAERYAGARVVAFSTGNVYPCTPGPGRGAAEDHPLTPLGEYANACVGRERVLEWACERGGSPLALVRLSYAVDLRYGVLVDLAQRVRTGEPVDVRTGWVNVIWQGDANAQALECFAVAATPAFPVNVTGPEPLAVADLARRYGRMFGRAPHLVGTTAADALLSDTTRATRLFGAPSVPTARLIDWVGEWLNSGGPTLGKPTKFEVRDGRY
ncbi:epimerase [Gemmatimonadetes bacterium T265]|nr:epimerase [Gemmatimonadetes bacterium T265]